MRSWDVGGVDLVEALMWFAAMILLFTLLRC